MTEQERRAELRKLAEAATQAKANGDTWMAVHPDTLTVLTEEIAALKEKVKRQAEALTLAANAYERGQRDGIAAAVKVTPTPYPVEKSKRTNEFVRETFATGSHQSWAILGQSWAQNTPVPKGGAPAAK